VRIAEVQFQAGARCERTINANAHHLYRSFIPTHQQQQIGTTVGYLPLRVIDSESELTSVAAYASPIQIS